MGSLIDYRGWRDYLLSISNSSPLPKGTRYDKTSLYSAHNVAPCYEVPKNLPIPISSPCLIWRVGLTRGGHAKVNGKGGHRKSYLESTGLTSLTSGMYVNHLCQRPSCIQPSHLYLGTPKENREDEQYWTFKIMGRSIESEIPGFSYINKRWQIINERDQYNIQPTFIGEESWQPETPHRCHYNVRAGSVDICRICGRSLSSYITKPIPGICVQCGGNTGSNAIDCGCPISGPPRISIENDYIKLVNQTAQTLPYREKLKYLNNVVKNIEEHPCSWRSD